MAQHDLLDEAALAHAGGPHERDDARLAVLPGHEGLVEDGALRGAPRERRAPIADEAPGAHIHAHDTLLVLQGDAGRDISLCPSPSPSPSSSLSPNCRSGPAARRIAAS